ncbi:MAG: hypothetical protein KJN89_04780 [Gammaproteobacteria bacterium]|nr:hypothetical protein [Gammaproteobacteria bacterium]MBT8134741.1 hypothetical protein [Gammaproteobacteria bacterium]NNJ49667.1 hypothetical protein [Gammaproteobacteria bacterium]
MNESNTDDTEANEMLASLANDIVNLMLREHQSIHQELDHVSNLISDASKSLSSSFDEINTIAIKQNSLLNTDSKVSKETSDDLATQLKKNQLNVVTALQFDDIVQQLTKHSQSRTSHIQMMFNKLATYLDEIKELEYKSAPAINDRIHDLRHDVAKLRIELEKENPVKQTSLSTGKTELF